MAIWASEECARAEFYPCVSAHLDTVHEPQPIQVVQEGDRLWALDKDHRRTGLGGDDKAGIFICLQLIEKIAKIKAAFFVAEEIGCQGSRACNDQFFDDVGYVMAFDSPGDNILTYTCDGTQLFPDEGLFHDTMLPILKAHGVTDWQHHPYTDVSVLKRKFDFPCLNLPAGYFRMHSGEEYVLLTAVANGIALGKNLISAFGHRHYRYLATDKKGRPALNVSGLCTC
jgi:tripeptide aminopeptidase